ncbi:MAG: TIGR02611 family protein [Candidatus Saccharimonas sp.]
MSEIKRRTRKGIIIIVGGIVLLVGLVMVPYPGPGWLIVFAGLSILATEFRFAAETLRYARGKYDSWTAWVTSQNISLRISLFLGTGVVVVLTVWLVNGLGIINHILSLGQDWLVSPFFR